MLPAYRENMPMTFKRYLDLWLYFDEELKSARSISQTSIFITIYGMRKKVFRKGLCKVYLF